MAKKEFISIWADYHKGYDTHNPCEDGYWQYWGGCYAKLSNKEVIVEVINQSCGELGEDIIYEVSTPGYHWHWRVGNIDGRYYTPEDKLYDIYESMRSVLRVEMYALTYDVKNWLEWIAIHDNQVKK